MGELLSVSRRRALLALALMLGLAAIAVAPLRAAHDNSFAVVPLVSDQPGVADHTDPNLVNAWGLTSVPTTPVVGRRQRHRQVDALPRRRRAAAGARRRRRTSAPTGTVFNHTAGFVVRNGRSGRAVPVRTEEGKILGWNPASIRRTRSWPRTDRRGCDLQGSGDRRRRRGPRLYAADFHNGRVDVFDGSFGARHDARLRRPEPAERLCAVRDPDDRREASSSPTRSRTPTAEDEVAGQGKGFVDAFDSERQPARAGREHGQLNAPWGLAWRPPSFGRSRGDLLVGNFGDGQINAYASTATGTSAPRRAPRLARQASSIDGLWALLRPGGNNGPAGTLFFTAGPDDETHGLFGQIVGGWRRLQGQLLLAGELQDQVGRLDRPGSACRRADASRQPPRAPRHEQPLDRAVQLRVLERVGRKAHAEAASPATRWALSY